LKKLLPHVQGSGITHEDDISGKAALVKILLAFEGQDLFEKEEFRRLILHKLLDEEIRGLANELNMDSTLDFQVLVDKISDLKWGHNENSKLILKHLKMPERYLPSKKSSPPNIELIRKPQTEFKRMYDFQNCVYNKALKNLDTPSARFMIQMPTGSGKTKTAMELVCYCLKNNPGKAVIWLAHSEELCEQAAQCFTELWSHIGNCDIELIRVWGPNKLKIPEQSAFIVAGFPKLNSEYKRDKDLPQKVSDKLSHIFVDEAHRAVAKTYTNTLFSMLHANSKIQTIGLTATPGRSGKETEQLVNLFFNEMIEIDSGDETVFEYLRRRKFLSNVILDPIDTGITYNLTKKDKEYIEKFLDFPKGFLETISNDDIRNIMILEKLRKECESNRKILFFGASVSHSKFICACLHFLGFKTEHLDGTSGSDRRRSVIEDFKTGDLNVICNYGILTTGFDAPKTEVVFIARPTMSVVLYSQMIGRGLRGPAMGGTETCKIIDVKDNIETYRDQDSVYNYFRGYWTNE
jgi:superfamily II DNA or RNA helicase